MLNTKNKMKTMKTMKTTRISRYAKILAVILVVAALAGCGNDNDDNALVGTKWRMIMSDFDETGSPATFTMTFTSNTEVKMEVVADNMSVTINGTYEFSDPDLVISFQEFGGLFDSDDAVLNGVVSGKKITFPGGYDNDVVFNKL